MKMKNFISNRSISGILFRLFGFFVLKLIFNSIHWIFTTAITRANVSIGWNRAHGGCAMYIASSTLHIRPVPETNVTENGGSRLTVHFAFNNSKTNMYKYNHRFGFLESNHNNNPFPWLFFFCAFTTNVQQNGLRCKAQNTYSTD